eukprot:GGOE01023007.1.p3 GENE.GGOE01023007.1~~GGOE01023007.1.p3  ORF type:complete len:102 (+),score=9.06 GGOE01023007.1:234-539(+)
MPLTSLGGVAKPRGRRSRPLFLPVRAAQLLHRTSLLCAATSLCRARSVYIGASKPTSLFFFLAVGSSIVSGLVLLCLVTHLSSFLDLPTQCPLPSLLLSPF